MNELYTESLNYMEGCFNKLSDLVPQPTKVRMGDGYNYRYIEKTIYQAIILKLARSISGLHSIGILNTHGFLQDQAALQRTLDEFHEDILFLCFSIIFNDAMDIHSKYLEYFWEEEFDDETSAINSTQKRGMVRRSKILAYLSQERGTGYDKSTSNEVHRTINKMYSGYVHGASTHIMELYYGVPPRFHMSSNLDSPLFHDHEHDLLNYFYRGIMSFAFAAQAFESKEIFNDVYHYSLYFAKVSGNEHHLREQK